MTIRITLAHANGRLAATRDLLDDGVAAATIEIRTGAQPAAVDDAPGGTVLLVVELEKPCGTIAGGVLSLRQAFPSLTLENGTAGWARWCNGNGQVVMDTPISIAGGGAPVQLTATALLAGTLVTLQSAELT